MSHLDDLRRAFESADQPKNGAGLYMLTLKPSCTVPGIAASKGDILYVGKAGDLKKRNHMRGPTSSCTLRRSLAALLPDLHAIPEASTSKQSANWTLEPASDARLTAWMVANLDVTRIRIPVDKSLSPKDQRYFLEAEERKLIAEALPPLNLRDWPSGKINPHKALIESARARLTDQIRADHRALREAKLRSGQRKAMAEGASASR